MPVTQDRLTRLREFGLSEYAARSYLALLDLGIAEARDVSALSKVPQAKIYHVLEQLHDKGLVVILPEFPKKYAPVPFAEYLGRLYDEHSKAAQSIDEQRADLAEMFRVMGDTDVGDRGFFTVIRGRRNVISKIEEMIAQTQKDLVVLGTSGTASRAQHMLPELRRARERNVRVRFLAPVDAETIDKLSTIAQVAELRARELGDEEQSAKVAIVISDAARAFLIHFVPDDNNLYNGKDIGVFTDQEAMVAAIQALVEPHWGRSARYERRADEIAHGRVAEFTRVYDNEHEAREALSRALRGGAKEALVVNGFGRIGTPDDFLVAERQRAVGVQWRVLLDVRTAPEVRAWLDVGDAALHVRHMQTSPLMRNVIVDAREVFYAIGSRGGHAEVIVHTNAPAVVAALREHFDRLWKQAVALEERAKELEIFPDLLPGDIGIGRLFHVLRDAVVVADGKGAVALWNPSATATFARGPAQTRGRPLVDVIAPDARQEFAERFERFSGNATADDAEFFETTGVRSDGETFPLEATLSLLRTAELDRYVVAVLRDISARRKAQRAELEATDRIRRAYEQMPEAFYVLDQGWRFVYRNPVAREMTALADEKVDGQIIWTAFPELAGTKFESELRRVAETRQPAKFVEQYAPLGRWFEVNAHPSPEGVSVYFRDITQHHLGTSLLASTLDATPDGVLVISREGAIAGSNAAFREMWGIPRDIMEKGDEAMLEYVASLLDDPAEFRRKVVELYAEPEAESHDKLTFKDGRVFERFSRPQRVAGETIGRVWSFRDVTPAKAATARARATR